MAMIYCAPINTLRPRQNGRHFADDAFKCVFLKENVMISIKISLKFVSRSTTINIPTLIQIMAWRRSCDKLLSESMMVRLPTHICVTRPQLVNYVHGCAVPCFVRHALPFPVNSCNPFIDINQGYFTDTGAMAAVLVLPCASELIVYIIIYMHCEIWLYLYIS